MDTRSMGIFSSEAAGVFYACYLCFVSPQCVADACVQGLESHPGVILAGEYQKRIEILLRAPIGSFRRAFCDEDDRSHVSGLAVFIAVDRRRQKRRERIAILVSAAGARGTDMCRNSLRAHGKPLAPRIIIPVQGEFEFPQCGVDAHSGCAKSLHRTRERGKRFQ